MFCYGRGGKRIGDVQIERALMMKNETLRKRIEVLEQNQKADQASIDQAKVEVEKE